MSKVMGYVSSPKFAIADNQIRNRTISIRMAHTANVSHLIWYIFTTEYFLLSFYFLRKPIAIHSSAETELKYTRSSCWHFKTNHWLLEIIMIMSKSNSHKWTIGYFLFLMHWYNLTMNKLLLLTLNGQLIW